MSQRQKTWAHKLLKDFRFSTIDNITANITLFDESFRLVQLREMREADEQLISSLKSKGIDNVFQILTRTESKPKQQFSSEVEKYFELIEKRFHDGRDQQKCGPLN